MQAACGEGVLSISQDCFYRNLTPPQREGIAAYNFDHPDAFDFDMIAQTLQSLRRRDAVDIPIYDFVSSSRCSASTRVETTEVILFDGILAFYEERVRDLLDLKIFVDADADLRLARRLRRDIVERGRQVLQVRALACLRPTCHWRIAIRSLDSHGWRRCCVWTCFNGGQGRMHIAASTSKQSAKCTADVLGRSSWATLLRLRCDVNTRLCGVQVLEQYEATVKPSFDSYILPTKRHADIIVPRGAENVAAIDLIWQNIRYQIQHHVGNAQPGKATREAQQDQQQQTEPALAPQLATERLYAEQSTMREAVC